MPLYLDEIWLKWSSAEQATQALKQFRNMGTGQFPYPEGVSLAAGPWFSNEEAKIILVLDIADHAKTFDLFSLALVLYFILAQAINFGMRNVERRLSRGRMRGGLS